MDLEQEKKLVERARNDIEAFGELYDLYYPQILGYVIRRTANIGTAQDITSEVFINALKNIGRFQWRGIPFSAWLFRIATHEIANNFHRKKQGLLSLEQVSSSFDISDNSSAEDELIEAETELRRHQEYLILHKNISKLSVKYQEVITLRFFEKKQIKEIGEILGKQEGTVKSLLHRGLKKLRILME
jgi:RNA polymerase sigma-70 factor (ECF subfamily)